MASNSSSSSSAPAAVEVDGSVWRAVVGSSVEIPPVNSYVYYFPEGHLEHNYDFTPHPTRGPFIIPCQLTSLRFLSDPTTDRPFVKMHLRPLGPHHVIINNNVVGIEKLKDDVVSFAKALTPSDANNGGGFSVPKFCAEMVFPRLAAAGGGRPPSQDLTVRDAGRDQSWRFRHIYRGTPRRHLVSTGWTQFVRAKRLVTGDAVVFVRKKSTEELFVGVRRARRLEGGGRRHGEAAEVARRAAAGMEFEVVYYPEFGSPDFVVRAEKVREALEMKWRAGMRVRMAVDGDDFSRLAWFQGTVEASSSPSCFTSPWRMLQVKWDEGELVWQKRVCPWQVEHIPTIEPYFHPLKKMKNANDSMPGGIHGARRDDEDENHIMPKNVDQYGSGSSVVSTALSIGSSGMVHGSSRYCFRLFGKNIVEMASEPIVVRGGTKRSAGCTYGLID